MHKNISFYDILRTKNNFKTAGKFFFNPFLANFPSWHPLKASGFLVFSVGIKKENWPERLILNGILTSVRNQCCHFILPKNTKKPEVFWCFQGV